MYDISQDVIQLGINKQLPFTLDEADYWFANADKIYSGSLLRDALSQSPNRLSEIQRLL